MPHSHLTGGRPPNPRLLSPTQLSELIDATGFSQRRLGRILGVTDRTIRHWKSGRACPAQGIILLLRLFALKRQEQAI